MELKTNSLTSSLVHKYKSKYIQNKSLNTPHVWGNIKYSPCLNKIFFPLQKVSETTLANSAKSQKLWLWKIPQRGGRGMFWYIHFTNFRYRHFTGVLTSPCLHVLCAHSSQDKLTDFHGNGGKSFMKTFCAPPSSTRIVEAGLSRLGN